MKPQMKPRPRFVGHPIGFVGPHPHKWGKALIIRYLGYFRTSKRTDRGRDAKIGHHKYLIKCVNCGAELERLQDSILRARRLNAEGCTKCCKRNPKETIKKNELWDQRLKDRAEWVALMQLMPVTPLAFIPVQKRFDGRRI